MAGVHEDEIHEDDELTDLRFGNRRRRRAAPNEVRFVLKTRASGVLHEGLPPKLMWLAARPALEGIEVSPVVAHPSVRRKKRKQDVLAQQ
jgi:hypothetical protein